LVVLGPVAYGVREVCGVRKYGTKAGKSSASVVKHVSAVRHTDDLAHLVTAHSELSSHSCLLGLMYQLSDIDTETGNFYKYSYERLRECMKTQDTSLADELDIDHLLQSKGSYWPEYWRKSEYSRGSSEVTMLNEFTKRGLTSDSNAAGLVKRINRLPFVEHWLRTRSIPWITSSLTSALQMLHLLIDTLPRLGIDIREMRSIMDAGCGTGFIVTALALHVNDGTVVQCVEYERWVHQIGRRAAQRGGIYDLEGVSHLANKTEDDVLSRIQWVHGDAIEMKERSSGTSLGTHDLILFGISLPPDRFQRRSRTL